MIPFRRILLPVDFSPRSSAIAPAVQAMMKRFGAELIVLHVVDLPPAGIAPPEAAAWATLIGADRLRKQRQIALENFMRREFAGMDVKVESEEGDPATVIADYARENAIDLIMMPTSGLGAFRRFILGSVTTKVLHDTNVPVWTGVHAEEIAAHPAGDWKRVVCAMEDHPRELSVLRWAAEFSSEQKLELRLVHAVRGPEDCESNPSFQKFLFDTARERIDQLQAQAGTSFEVCLQLGHPGHVVHQVAYGYSADLVIIGRGLLHKPFGRLRSSAYEIIREAPCPVISV
ncbi:MAG TPA: universal stress protein [Bryobacteraceae bacterium]|nr:universal stress protein [Bryobacteraceae bacterium]